MEFARETFRLDLPGEDGVALREKLAHLGKDRPEPELPAGAAHVWEWFGELNLARTGNGFGANPFTYAEISAWASLLGRCPRPWEVVALKALDRAYLEAVAK